ncbi:hypothetical protein C8R47DRAFT_1084224 [Mycena vitilis]|nr:hypothetical protein C8R47DRAFT_1084224 [Mycena vitilis]
MFIGWSLFRLYSGYPRHTGTRFSASEDAAYSRPIENGFEARIGLTTPRTHGQLVASNNIYNTSPSSDLFPTAGCVTSFLSTYPNSTGHLPWGVTCDTFNRFVSSSTAQAGRDTPENFGSLQNVYLVSSYVRSVIKTTVQQRKQRILYKVEIPRNASVGWVPGVSRLRACGMQNYYALMPTDLAALH